MLLILITLPTIWPGEGAALTAMLEAGLPRLHIRKPQATKEEVAALLAQIPTKWYEQISLHDAFTLALEVGKCGLHLNSRNPRLPQGYTGCVSMACHQLTDLATCKICSDYVLLSPIFDSISKTHYHAAYTHEALMQAQQKGLIDQQVVALGGVTAQTIPQVRDFGFGGAAILGDLWQRPAAQWVPHLQELLTLTQSIHP